MQSFSTSVKSNRGTFLGHLVLGVEDCQNSGNVLFGLKFAL